MAAALDLLAWIRGKRAHTKRFLWLAATSLIISVAAFFAVQMDFKMDIDARV